MNSSDKTQEYTKVLNYIIDEINQGRLVEGSRIESERELSDRLGTSRTSTREALGILRGMGIVDSRPGSGNYIANNTDKTIKQMVNIMLKMGSISLKEIIDYRRFISRAIGTELLEKGMRKEYQDQITSILKAMHGASDEEFCELDRQFHSTLIKATENKLFNKVMEPIGQLYIDIIEVVIMGSTPLERINRIPMHENIYKSIINKDVNASIKYIKAHYDYVESKFDL